MGRFKRWIPSFLLSVTPIFAVTIQPTPLPAANPVTVRVWQLPSERETMPNRVAEYRVAQRFQQLHPEIRLEGSTHLQIEGSGAEAALLMQVAGGSAPDIFSMTFRHIDTFVRQGFLHPLDEEIAALAPEEYVERLPDKIVPVIRQKGREGDLHYWALPQQIVATVLCYRKDLFAEAGLDPERPPRDWDELKAAIIALADPSRGRYGLAFGVGERTGFTMMPYLNGAGAKVMTQADDGAWSACFDSPEAVEAYTYIDELLKTKVTKNGKTGLVIQRSADLYAGVKEGKVAMYYGGSEFPMTPPEVTGMAPVPQGPDGHSGTLFNAKLLGIFSGVKDPRVRRAAWKYIHFVDSDEARRIYTQTMVELGAANFLNPLWLEKYGYPEVARRVPPALVSTFRNASTTGTPDPYGKNCQMIYHYLGFPLEEMLQRDFFHFTQEQKKEAIHTLLKEAVKKTNERMLDHLPPDERARRNSVGWAVAALVLAIFGGFLVLIFRWMKGNKAASPMASQQKLLPVMFLFPAVLLIAMWHYYPLLRGSVMAFQEYRLMEQSHWIGIANFSDALFDARFWLSLGNAFYFCTLWMLLGFVPPVLLAILLHEIPLGKVTFRVLFYIPAVVSGVVILFMWRAIYDPSPDGVLNTVIAFAGIPAQTWLQDSRLAMLCVVFPLAWAHLGPGSLIYLAALKGIPEELYEASEIDGAGFRSKLKSIVFPYLKPLLVINAVGATIYGFKSSDAVLAMTGGGPNLATQVIGYEIWQRTFLFLKFGQGAAMAWMLGLLLMGFTAFQMRMLAKVEFRTAGR